MDSEEARWLAFLDHPNGEKAVPEPWKANVAEQSPEVEYLLKMIIIRALRPDRVMAATRQLVDLTLGDQLMSSGAYDLGQVVESDSKARNPLLLVSAPGYDASIMVD
jgi:dynein heavy chain 1